MSVARWLLEECAGQSADIVVRRFSHLPAVMRRMESFLSSNDRQRFVDALEALRKAGVKAGLARHLASAACAVRVLEMEVSMSRLGRLR